MSTPHRLQVAILGALLLMPGMAALAQVYPIADGELTATDTSVSPGSPVTVSGDGFAPGAEIVLTIESQVVELGRVTADATGAFTAQVTIPFGLPAGTHNLKATGEAATGGIRVLAVQVAVEGVLPFTGTALPVLPIAAAAAVALVAGGLALRASKR